MKLVIIESPFKRESLKKYLGPDYEVFATKGHIRDLPQKSFGLDVKILLKTIGVVLRHEGAV